MDNKKVTIVCHCGSEWDLKSPITLLEVRPLTVRPALPTVTVGISEAADDVSELGFGRTKQPRVSKPTGESKQ